MTKEEIAEKLKEAKENGVISKEKYGIMVALIENNDERKIKAVNEAIKNQK